MCVARNSSQQHSVAWNRIHDSVHANIRIVNFIFFVRHRSFFCRGSRVPDPSTFSLSAELLLMDSNHIKSPPPASASKESTKRAPLRSDEERFEAFSHCSQQRKKVQDARFRLQKMFKDLEAVDNVRGHPSQDSNVRKPGVKAATRKNV